MAALALATAGNAQAQAFRTYLSETGLDTNNCSLQSPCRLLPEALSRVAAGGEVWILDSANFNTGTVTVNKSVTILAVPGAVGSFIANSGDALSISGAGIRVVLRNLVFVNFAGAGNSGVQFSQGSGITIRDSSFTGLTTAGVQINAPGSRSQILNSSFTSNTIGVRVFNGRVTMDGNNLITNTIAVEAAGNGGANLIPPSGTTMVRVSGGNIIDNGTAFHMDGAGLRADSSCNGSNIYLRSPSTSTLHLVGNGTYVNVTGDSHLTGTCAPAVTIDGYASPAV